MDRPRIAAVLSTVAASASAFLVVSRSSLLGTLAGASLVPIIYTVVSHMSSAGLDRAGEWVHWRLPRRPRDGGQTTDVGGEGRSEAVREGGPVQPAPESHDVSDRPEITYYQTSRRRWIKPQWLLVGSAAVAMAVSAYAVASPHLVETVEKVVVKEQVVQKMVTVTTVVEDQPDATYAARTTTATGSATEQAATEAAPADVTTTDGTAADTSGATGTTVDPSIGNGSGTDTATTESVPPTGDTTPPTVSTDNADVTQQDEGADLPLPTP